MYFVQLVMNGCCCTWFSRTKFGRSLLGAFKLLVFPGCRRRLKDMDEYAGMGGAFGSIGEPQPLFCAWLTVHGMVDHWLSRVRLPPLTALVTFTQITMYIPPQ
jgi:hypothetical protein